MQFIFQFAHDVSAANVFYCLRRAALSANYAPCRRSSFCAAHPIQLYRALGAGYDRG